MPTYAINKKARFDYEILDTLEAGLVLTGAEVKSVRKGNISLKGGFITFHGTIPMMTNVHIGAYKNSSHQEGYDPTHSRAVLLNAKEINYLREKMPERGLTIVPLSVYTKGRRVKLEIGLAKGKKQADKRETIKKREVKREMARQLRG